MDERDEIIARSVANLWTFHAAFMGRLMLRLRSSGALSAVDVEQMLQSLDQDCEILEGQDDQMYATGLLASVRAVLASPGYGRDHPSGGD